MYDLCESPLPLDEASARRIQRAAESLYRRVLAWASGVIAVLPGRLPLIEEDGELLTLFLAQQRRLNLELDGHLGSEESLFGHLACRLRLRSERPNHLVARAAHKLVCAYIEHAIEDALDRFCGWHGLDPSASAVIDWRVSIRYMAQELHRIACHIDIRKGPDHGSPHKFELNLRARELAANVALKRTPLLEALDTVVPR